MLLMLLEGEGIGGGRGRRLKKGKPNRIPMPGTDILIALLRSGMSDASAMIKGGGMCGVPLLMKSRGCAVFPSS